MRKLRDSHFEKGLSPLKRLSEIWEVVFFLRIWRCWLNENSYLESEHFITNNAYTCIELNAHLVLNIVYNVIVEKYPKEALLTFLNNWFTIL